MQCDAGGGAIDEKACGAFVMRWRMEMIGNLASRVMLPRFFLIFLLTWQCTISNSNSASTSSASAPYQHQQQWPSIILISTHRLSNGSKLFRNGLKLSPSLGWTIGHLWFILIEIEIDVQAHTYHFISLYCPRVVRLFSQECLVLINLKVPHASRVLGSRGNEFHVQEAGWQGDLIR